MRGITILTIIIGCLLTILQPGISLETRKADIREEYRKKDIRTWGDIFSWAFDQKEFKKSYALVIGIGNYNKDWPKLEAPYYDAVRVRDFLINEAGFDHVVTLTNAEATKKKIDKLMVETFPDLLGENDRFLFYFSGHGTQRPVGQIPFGYLVLQDCGRRSYADMISMEDVERWDRLLYRTRQVLFVLDSCFSGLAGRQRKSPLIDKKLTRLSQYAHHLITAGTADEESVASLNEWGGSLFTDSLLRGLIGRADLSSRDYAPDGVVSLKELMKYVGDRIDDESSKLKARNPLSKGIKLSPQISDLQENEGEFFFITKGFKNQKMGNVPDNSLAYGWPVGAKRKVSVKGPERVLRHKGDLLVPNSFAEFFAHYVDKPSLHERALNTIGLTSQDIGRSFALIAGVSYYPNMPVTARELRPAAEDIKKLQEYLKRYEFFDEIVVLKDEDVTLENLTFFLQTYFPNRLMKFPKSRFLFAYSGHGMNEGPEGYLIKNNARSTTDKANSIKLAIVRVLFDEVVKSGHHVLVLLNACYSGAFLRRSFGPMIERFIPRYRGAHVISAGGTGELTWHIPEVGTGSVFFEKVFAGLDGRADFSNDGIITVYELFTYLKREVQVFTDQTQNPQLGDISKHGSKGEFFFLNRDRSVNTGMLPVWKPGTKENSQK